MTNVKHPIVFLDVAGVLATAKYHRDIVADTRSPSKYRLDPGCCSRLQRLVETTGAHVVITSSWRRHDEDMLYLLRFLFEHNYNIPIIGSVPASPDGWREGEIGAWLHDNYVAHNCFVVLDDEDTDLASVDDHLVVVDKDVGLTDEDVQDATKIIESHRKSLDDVKDLSDAQRLKVFKKLRR